MLNDLKRIPLHDLCKGVCTALQRGNIPHRRKWIKMMTALEDTAYNTYMLFACIPLKYSVTQKYAQCWICKDSTCPGHLVPTNKSVGWPPRGPLMPRLAPRQAVRVQMKECHRLTYMARGKRFQASQHVIIITPHKEPQRHVKTKTGHFSPEEILIVCNPATGKTQMIRIFPCSVKYTSS